MLYIHTKFYENICNGLKVKERISFHYFALYYCLMVVYIFIKLHEDTFHSFNLYSGHDLHTKNYKGTLTSGPLPSLFR